MGGVAAVLGMVGTFSLFRRFPLFFFFFFGRFPLYILHTHICTSYIHISVHFRYTYLMEYYYTFLNADISCGKW